MKKDDIICTKFLIKAVSELNQTRGISIFTDEFKDAGLNPLLDLLAYILFHPHEDIYWEDTIFRLYDTWDDPQCVEAYFIVLIKQADKSKRKFAYGFNEGQLLLLDNRLEML